MRKLTGTNAWPSPALRMQMRRRARGCSREHAHEAAVRELQEQHAASSQLLLILLLVMQVWRHGWRQLQLQQPRRSRRTHRLP